MNQKAFEQSQNNMRFKSNLYKNQRTNEGKRKTLGDIHEEKVKRFLECQPHLVYDNRKHEEEGDCAPRDLSKRKLVSLMTREFTKINEESEINKLVNIS